MIIKFGGEYLSKPNQNQQQEYRRVRTPRSGEIPGKMKKRIWIREGDIILVKPWEFQSDEKADVIWRYTKTEASWLERKGYLKM